MATDVTQFTLKSRQTTKLRLSVQSSLYPLVFVQHETVFNDLMLQSLHTKSQSSCYTSCMGQDLEDLLVYKKMRHSIRK